jgi:hypothetical protein
MMSRCVLPIVRSSTLVWFAGNGGTGWAMDVFSAIFVRANASCTQANVDFALSAKPETTELC